MIMLDLELTGLRAYSQTLCRPINAGNLDIRRPMTISGLLSIEKWFYQTDLDFDIRKPMTSSSFFTDQTGDSDVGVADKSDAYISLAS